MDRKKLKSKNHLLERKSLQYWGQKRAETGGMKRAPQVLAYSAHMIDKGILSQPAWP